MYLVSGLRRFFNCSKAANWIAAYGTIRAMVALFPRHNASTPCPLTVFEITFNTFYKIKGNKLLLWKVTNKIFVTLLFPLTIFLQGLSTNRFHLALWMCSLMRGSKQLWNKSAKWNEIYFSTVLKATPSNWKLVVIWIFFTHLYRKVHLWGWNKQCKNKNQLKTDCGIGYIYVRLRRARGISPREGGRGGVHPCFSIIVITVLFILCFNVPDSILFIIYWYNKEEN